MKTLSLVFMALSLVCASFAHAEEQQPQWQIDAGSNSFLSYTQEGDDQGHTTEFNLATHAYYFLSPHWEAGAYFLYTHEWPNNDNDSTSFRFVPSAVYNFSNTPLSSWFVRGGVGIYVLDSATNHSYTALGFVGSIGKHFPITSTVTWTPEVGVSGHTRATDDNFYWSSLTDLELTLFQFSILF